jgi:hypothetical protein
LGERETGRFAEPTPCRYPPHRMTGPDNNDRKVLLRTPDGMYLSRGSDDLRLSNDVYSAVVCDYLKDQVEEKLSLLQRVHGLVLQAVPLNWEDIYETCDRCRQMVVPLRVFFDGKQFLCEECRKANPAT